MSNMNVKEGLYSLIRLLQDATNDYEDQLMAAGNEDLANEWRWNLGDLLSDAGNIAGKLASAYAAAPEEIPESMRSFLQEAVYTPEISSRGHITRLKDVLEGRPPSWPEEVNTPIDELLNVLPAPKGVAAVAWDWGWLMWRFRNATDGYVYQLRAAGMGDLADGWKDVIWKLTCEVMASGESLKEVYTSPPDQLPATMRKFFDRALHAASETCRAQITRLKDSVE